jgi:hypothetical protein
MDHAPLRMTSYADENSTFVVGASLPAADASIVVKPGSTVAGVEGAPGNTTTTPSHGMKKKSAVASQHRRAFGDISNRKKEAPGGATGHALLPSVSKPTTNLAPQTATKKPAVAAVQILNDHHHNNSNKNVVLMNNNNIKNNNKQTRRVGFILPDDKENDSSNNNNINDDNFDAAAVQPKPSSSTNSSSSSSSNHLLQNDHDIVDAIEMPAGRTWLEQQELDNNSVDDDVLSVEDYLIDPVAIMQDRLALQDEMEEQAVAESWNALERRMAQLEFLDNDDERHDNDHSTLLLPLLLLFFSCSCLTNQSIRFFGWFHRSCRYYRSYQQHDVLFFHGCVLSWSRQHASV